MTNENDRSTAFVRACIDYLEGHSERVRKAITSLRVLQATAAQLDPENIEVMAKAILDRCLTPPHMSPHGAVFFAPHGEVTTSQVKFSDDVLPPFDPDSPTRAPDDQEVTHFQRIVNFFVQFRNRPVSTSTLVTGSKLGRGAVATVLYTTHRDKFEKLKVNNNLNRWRLKPEVYEQLIREQGEQAGGPAGPDKS